MSVNEPPPRRINIEKQFPASYVKLNELSITTMCIVIDSRIRDHTGTYIFIKINREHK